MSHENELDHFYGDRRSLFPPAHRNSKNETEICILRRRDSQKCCLIDVIRKTISSLFGKLISGGIRPWKIVVISSKEEF